jgi:OHS family lactose permease-like MFS transporter
MVGVSFGHSLGLAILSPIVGISYDRIGFQHTYFLIAAFALMFWIASTFSLAQTPPTDASGTRVLDSSPLGAGAVEIPS